MTKPTDSVAVAPIDVQTRIAALLTVQRERIRLEELEKSLKGPVIEDFKNADVLKFTDAAGNTLATFSPDVPRRSLDLDTVRLLAPATFKKALKESKSDRVSLPRRS